MEQLTTEQILLNLIAHLDTSSRKVPIIGKVVLVDDVVAFVQRALQQYGDDLKEADAIIRNSDAILDQTHKQRDAILADLQRTIETTDMAQATNSFCEQRLQETEELRNARLEETEIEIAAFLAEAQETRQRIMTETQETRQRIMMETDMYVSEVLNILKNRMDEHENTLKNLQSDLYSYQHLHTSKFEENLQTLGIREHSTTI